MVHKLHKLWVNSVQANCDQIRSSCPSSSLSLEEDVVGWKVLHIINNEDQEALGYKTLRHKNAITSCKENKALGHFLYVFSPYNDI